METGLPLPSDFRRNNYDVLSRIASPAYVAENLRRRFGEELDDPQSYPLDSMNPNRRIAHQFMAVHQFVQNEQLTAPDQAE